MSVNAMSSGGQMPAFPTKMSSPPNSRIARSNSDVVPAAADRSAACANARTPRLASCCTTSAASVRRDRYPMPTSAPQSASSRAVAAPMPRDPPVTRARLPRRLITPTSPGSRRELRFDRLADRVLDAEVNLLRTICAVGGNDDGMVRNGPQRPAIAGRECDHRRAFLLRRFGRLDHVRRVAARGMNDQQVARRHERLHLPGENLVEAEIVPG